MSCETRRDCQPPTAKKCVEVELHHVDVRVTVRMRADDAPRPLAPPIFALLAHLLKRRQRCAPSPFTQRRRRILSYSIVIHIATSLSLSLILTHLTTTRPARRGRCDSEHDAPAFSFSLVSSSLTLRRGRAPRPPFLPRSPGNDDDGPWPRSPTHDTTTMATNAPSPSPTTRPHPLPALTQPPIPCCSLTNANADSAPNPRMCFQARSLNIVVIIAIVDLSPVHRPLAHLPRPLVRSAHLRVVHSRHNDMEDAAARNHVAAAAVVVNSSPFSPPPHPSHPPRPFATTTTSTMWGMWQHGHHVAVVVRVIVGPHPFCSLALPPHPFRPPRPFATTTTTWGMWQRIHHVVVVVVNPHPFSHTHLAYSCLPRLVAPTSPVCGRRANGSIGTAETLPKAAIAM